MLHLEAAIKLHSKMIFCFHWLTVWNQKNIDYRKFLFYLKFESTLVIFLQVRFRLELKSVGLASPVVLGWVRRGIGECGGAAGKHGVWVLAVARRRPGLGQQRSSEVLSWKWNEKNEHLAEMKQVLLQESNTIKNKLIISKLIFKQTNSFGDFLQIFLKFHTFPGSNFNI